jgi:autotransporter-associated beta strand protein
MIGREGVMPLLNVLSGETPMTASKRLNVVRQAAAPVLEALETRRMFYTYGGDSNLGGMIAVDDYTRIDFNVPLGNTGWYNGDFNYDGKINVDDYTIIDYNVGTPFTGGITPVGVTAVSATPLDINGTAKSDRIIVYSDLEGIAISVNGVVSHAYARPLRISGNSGDDVIAIETDALAAYPVTINGGAGNDTIYGNAEADRIFAGDGNDIVNGNDGRDTIYGETGDDSLRGGGGSDLCDGGDGIDTVRGDAGNDNLSGGANPDRLRGSAGNDTLDGGGGRDLLAGETGDDSLFGGTGEDVCDGGAGVNILRGGAGHDAIFCNDTDDVDFEEMNAGESSTTQNLTVDNGGSLTKTGAGTLTLSGTNNFSGAVTIAAGILSVATGTPSTLMNDFTVAGGASFHVAADNVNLPNVDVHLATGSVFQFDTPAGSAAIGSLSADANSYLVFNVSPTGHNELHIANAAGLNATGAVIKVHVTGDLAIGSHYPLITFTGTPPAADFVLAPIPDTTRVYFITVDQATGQVVLNVAHS